MITKSSLVLGYHKLLQTFLEEAISLELEEFLKKEKNNSKNGFYKRVVKSSYGKFTLKVARDRKGHFQTAFLPQRIKSIKSIEKILLLFFIEGYPEKELKRKFFEINSSLSEYIFMRLRQEALLLREKELKKSYKLLAIYPISIRLESPLIEFVDCYIAYGLNNEDECEIIGLWHGANKKSSFWKKVLTSLQQRGLMSVEMIAYEKLAGFKKVYPQFFPMAKEDKNLNEELYKYFALFLG